MTSSPKHLLAAALLTAGLNVHGQVDSTLHTVPDTSVAGNEARLPVYTITSDDLDAELGGQDVSGILQSSRDVFTSTAGFNFGSARFRIRGLDQENTLISINGVLVNDLETGWAAWTNWAGLNDVTRWMTVRSGINPSRINFGGIGGYVDLNMRASELRKGVRVSYASSNRAYRNRVMATYNSGMLANGWAYSVSASSRWANEGYIPGTYFNAFAYFLSVEKKLNKQHSLGFTAFGAPIEQGRQNLAIQEAYDLTGDNFYNSAWGFQNGQKRNARVSRDHKPTFLLTHYFRPTEGSKLTTTAFYTFGRDGQTNLNWFDAKDPRPDYYRYLPSYYTPGLSTGGQNDPAEAAYLTGLWQTDPNTQQINWDQLYFANGKNLYALQNAEGVAGNTLIGNRSKYIVEEHRTDPTRIGINSVYEKALDERTHLTVGGSYNKQVSHNFKVMEDLLGGDFWVDIDQFADRDFNNDTISQNDLSNPNNAVYAGDTFGYNYNMHVRMLNVFARGGLCGRLGLGHLLLARRQVRERPLPRDLLRQGRGARLPALRPEGRRGVQAQRPPLHHGQRRLAHPPAGAAHGLPEPPHARCRDRRPHQRAGAERRPELRGAHAPAEGPRHRVHRRCERPDLVAHLLPR
jgi:hypothetical protein